MEVKILNPEVLENLYKNHGEFACVCYDTPTKYAGKVGESCQNAGHMSGSRCEYIKFKITDCDRGTSEQALRHEIGTSVPDTMQDNWYISDYMERFIHVDPTQIVKNMASFRYIDKSDFKYETPATIRNSKLANDKYVALMADIAIARDEIMQILINEGIPKKRASQDANFVLPRATTTEFVIGFTPEALIHFCHKRLCTRAQEFINEMARQMKAECAKVNTKFATELVPQCQHLLWCPEEEKKSCGLMPTKNDVKHLIELGKSMIDDGR